MLLFCAVKRWVAPRQKFTIPYSGCCWWFGRPSCKGDDARVPSPKCCWCVPLHLFECLYITCCPWLQWFRVIGFVHGQCTGWCSCCVFTFCCIANPVGLALLCAFEFFFACCCINTWMRYKLRVKLGIAGSCWEDAAVHSGASLCGRMQEKRELAAHGYTGCMYDEQHQVDGAAGDMSAVVLPLGAVPGPQAGSELQDVATGEGGFPSSSPSSPSSSSSDASATVAAQGLASALEEPLLSTAPDAEPEEEVQAPELEPEPEGPAGAGEAHAPGLISHEDFATMTGRQLVIN